MSTFSNCCLSVDAPPRPMCLPRFLLSDRSVGRSQTEQDAVVSDTSPHIANIGRLVEDMENKIRNTLNEIYFGESPRQRRKREDIFMYPVLVITLRLWVCGTWCC